MFRAFAIGLLLLYYWYFTDFSLPFPSAPVPRPRSRKFPTVRPLVHSLRIGFSAPNVPMFRFMEGSTPTWGENIPPGYKIRDGRFHAKDACDSELDGRKILATGETLYRYVREERLAPFSPGSLSFEPDTDHIAAQDGNSFYFTCRARQISRLDMCPPGTLFREGECRPIDRCTGKPEGFVLPDPFDRTGYDECTKAGGVVRRRCATDEFFFYNACVSESNLAAYCRFNKDPLYLDEKTFVRCRGYEPVYETCPKGTRLFLTRNVPSFVCQPDGCAGRPDGTLLPLPPEEHRGGGSSSPFRFSRGYVECRSQIPSEPRFCAASWDARLSKGDNLTHLPMVFDGSACSVPSFCENVSADDPDAIVPAHEFTKNVPNWKFSEAVDHVEGYRCDGNNRKKRVFLPEGERIGKRFKAESACEGADDKVFLSSLHSSNWTRYYDCGKSAAETCPPPEIFDGVRCRPAIPHAQAYRGLGMFAFDGLAFDGWMKNWQYSNAPAKTCKGEENTLLAVYNVCSHPACVKYPFLAQVSFPVRLENGTECVKSNGVIVNRTSTERYAFWSQRPLGQQQQSSESSGGGEADECKPNTKVQSGNFVVDSSLYVTCNAVQPFVFCPSPLTTGLKSVSRNRYACDLADPLKVTFSPDSAIAASGVKFLQNELGRIVPADTTALPLPKVHVNDAEQEIPADGYVVVGDSGAVELKIPTADVVLHLRARISYPPDVAFTENGMKGPVEDQAYLIRHGGFTKLRVSIPQHGVKTHLSEFKTSVS